MNTNRPEEKNMTTTPVQPAPSGAREFARISGLTVLIGLAMITAYAGIRLDEPLLLVPILTSSLAFFLPRGNTVRIVLFAITAVGCSAMLAVVAFWFLLLAAFAG